MRKEKRYIKADLNVSEFNPSEYNRTPQKTRKTFTLDPIKPKTVNQGIYIDAIWEKTIVTSTGPAGTGKTYVAVHVACEMLLQGDVDKIILTKPAVEVGKTQGYLPGDIDEKMAPFIRSITDCFESIIGKAKYNEWLTAKKIEILPLNYVRGLTISNSIVICDESQNCTKEQMKALLTRIGEDSLFVLNGDVTQTDLSDASGFKEAIEILENVSETQHVEFDLDDIVRSGIAKEIIIAYHHHERK